MLFLGNLAKWFMGLWRKSHPKPTVVPDVASLPIPSPVSEIPESPPLDDIIQIDQRVRRIIWKSVKGNQLHRERAFLHTRRRIKERYSTPVYEFNLNRSLWEHWNHLIETNSPLALRLDTAGDPIWCIEHGPQRVFLIHHHGFVVTALPPNRREYPALIKRAMEKRHRPPVPLKTGRVSSKTVGKGILHKVEKPQPKPVKKKIVVPEAHQKLPPLHKRPPRNEALLKRLKNVEKKWEHD